SRPSPVFFLTDPAPTESYPLSLHDALPILLLHVVDAGAEERDEYMRTVREVLEEIGAHEVPQLVVFNKIDLTGDLPRMDRGENRSEEHTSELQSRENLVCRLLLEKKKEKTK